MINLHYLLNIESKKKYDFQIVIHYKMHPVFNIRDFFNTTHKCVNSQLLGFLITSGCWLAIFYSCAYS